MVEFQPSKLAVVGSNPIARSKKDGAGAVIVLLFVSVGIHGDLNLNGGASGYRWGMTCRMPT